MPSQSINNQSTSRKLTDLIDDNCELQNCCVALVKMLAASNELLRDQDDIKRLFAQIQWCAADDDWRTTSSGWLKATVQCNMLFIGKHVSSSAPSTDSVVTICKIQTKVMIEWYWWWIGWEPSMEPFRTITRDIESYTITSSTLSPKLWSAATTAVVPRRDDLVTWSIFLTFRCCIDPFTIDRLVRGVVHVSDSCVCAAAV